MLGAAVCALGLTAACFTAPPPDLTTTFSPPQIVHPSLVPPEGWITALPTGGFVAHVTLDQPTQHCRYSVLIDSVPVEPFCDYPCPSATSDGGPTGTDIPFSVGTPDMSVCHTIQLVVASAFAVNQSGDVQCGAAAEGYGDVATWQYWPPGCQFFDAGGIDGAIPDSGVDGTPLVPDTGAHP